MLAKLLAPAIPALAVHSLTERIGTASLVLSLGLYLTLLAALVARSTGVLKAGLMVTSILSAAVLSAENPLVGALAIAATALALIWRFTGIGPLRLAWTAAGALACLLRRPERLGVSKGWVVWTDGGPARVPPQASAPSGARDRILRVLRERGSMTKSELARVTGLSLPTVRKWVRELEEEGVVVEDLVSLNGRRFRVVAYVGH